VIANLPHTSFIAADDRRDYEIRGKSWIEK